RTLQCDLSQRACRLAKLCPQGQWNGRLREFQQTKSGHDGLQWSTAPNESRSSECRIEFAVSRSAVNAARRRVRAPAVLPHGRRSAILLQSRDPCQRQWRLHSGCMRMGLGSAFLSLEVFQQLFQRLLVGVVVLPSAEIRNEILAYLAG